MFFFFSDFKVTVMNEEESVMTSCKANHISMKIWNKSGTVKARPPPAAATLHPDSKRKNDLPGYFYFRLVSGARKILFTWKNALRIISASS